jgi:hypothetical protein
MTKEQFDRIVLNDLKSIKDMLGVEVYEKISAIDFFNLNSMRTETIKEIDKADKSSIFLLQLRIKLAYIEFRLENMILRRID